MFRHDENAAPTHAQFAMRVAILGGIALVAFAAIFFRLWFLEVLSGEAYLKEANANRVREIKIQAPRGEILDRAGRVLVDNKTVLSLQVRADELPAATTQARNKELRKLAEVARMRYDKVKQEIRQQTKRAARQPGDAAAGRRQGPRLLPARAPGRVPRRHRLAGLRPRLPERDARRPPVRLRHARSVPTSSRSRPTRASSRATGSAPPASRRSTTRSSAAATARSASRSTPPASRAAGELSRIEPEAGDNLKLTLDKKVQEAGEAALASRGLPGAFVAMNVHDGSILGMGSAPTFDPSVFTPPVSTDAIKNLTNDEENPLLDRAIQAGYPTGSTFKADHRLGGARGGIGHARAHVQRHRLVRATATTRGGTPAKRRTASSTWSRALRVSSDVFFYDIGLHGEQRLRRDRPGDHPGLGQAARLRRADRHRPARRGRRPGADAGVARQALRGRRQPGLLRRQEAPLRSRRLLRDRPPVERRRQHEPRGRPGRPAGDAAAARDRVRDDRQRRRGRPPAPRDARPRTRPGRRRRRSSRRRGARSTSAGRPARRSWRGCARRRWSPAAPPIRRSAATRSISPARPAPPRRPTRRTSPGTRRWRRPTIPKYVVVVTVERGGFGADDRGPGRLSDPQRPPRRQEPVRRGDQPDPVTANAA